MSSRTFANRFPESAEALWRRLSSLLVQGYDSKRSTHCPVADVTKFAGIAEALNQRIPGILFGEEATLVISSGRFLRNVLSDSTWSPTSLGSAVAMLEWCAEASVPPSTGEARLCDYIGQHVTMLGGTALWRSLSATLSHLHQSHPSPQPWQTLLQTLSKETPLKIHLLSAEMLLRLAADVLWFCDRGRVVQRPPPSLEME